MKNEYLKDDEIYVKNFSGTFNRVDDTAIALINSCCYVHKDRKGEYTKKAVRFDEKGNVYFEKAYMYS